MKVLVLNPPNKVRIQRRYMCSYNAPNFLLPPQELMALAGIAKSLDDIEVFLIDAIADGLDLHETQERISSIHPDLIIAIHGFECFEDDMNTLNKIKELNREATLVLFGYYASLFHEEILQKTLIDIIVIGEPDLIFKNLLEVLSNRGNLSEVDGIAYKANKEIYLKPGDGRIPHPDMLPMPAYELLHADKYFEPFLKPPFGLIQSARGCPYSCNYCVRSFGKRLTYRTSDQIIDELKFLKSTHGIKSFRFIDDTFTVHTNRVLEVCKKMIEQKINLEWSCLSRVDVLNEEMIDSMKKAGCIRIDFGIESGSERVLEALNKSIDLKKALCTIQKCKSAGIETLAFFIVGAPNEEEKDFEESVNFSIEANFDYIIVSELIPYPGTKMFETVVEQIDFQLFPYKNHWSDPSIRERNKRREKKFYKRFYFRPYYLFQRLLKFLQKPIPYLLNFYSLTKYLFSTKTGVRTDYI
jgi:anaerobic magnesium-protoporphyrin IX monomethyl ester cyclase